MKKPVLHDLLVDILQDTYDAEQQLLEALAEMEEAADNEMLQKCFAQHREETEEHMRRLEQAAEEIECELEGESCEGMAGLIEEAVQTMEMVLDPPLNDLALIAAAQKAEHYEIAAYGTMRELAKQMGHKKSAQLFDKTAQEEGDTDQKLTELAIEMMNELEA
jgi:ferritin-like metal-binding protein YciE